MGYFNPDFFRQPTKTVDAQFVELSILDEAFDEESEVTEMLVIYDACGGIKHTVINDNEPEREMYYE